ncbi:hypothetical protein N8T08_007725 [Aspergillus melleus]|uniref:Uncharacterized protein n=1 Tax=Aspergillus melleus TaxID=138277 RepID=A0ACC3BE20_9EURO|nr:hypothetical protein N8T08_007725 [Aspergillus melleus]
MAVRSGGHDFFGRSLTAGGVLLDMRRIKNVSIASDRASVRVGGGIIAGDLQEELDRHGLFTPTGQSKTVGYVSWACGGGYGFYVGSYGFGVDQILEAKVVTASGTVINTREDEELLWALRGAGAGFHGGTYCGAASDTSALDEARDWVERLKEEVERKGLALTKRFPSFCPPEEVNLLQSFDQQTLERLESLKRRIDPDNRFHGGTFMYIDSFGETTDGTCAEATDPPVYAIASCTKLLTTIAALQCVDKGLLELDVPIDQVLPEWENPKVLRGVDVDSQPILEDARRQITLRQLLTHTSGMAYALEYVSPDLVERVNGIRLGEYMQRHIFQPLGIRDMAFDLEKRHDMRDRKVQCYERSDDGELKKGHWSMRSGVAVEDFGGGGLYATVPDLLKVYSAVLRRDSRLLSLDMFKLMYTPQLETKAGLDCLETKEPFYTNSILNSVPLDIPISFGLGGLLNLRPVEGRRGALSLTWSGVTNCYWWIDPEHGVAGVYLSQLLPPGDPETVRFLAKFEEMVYMSACK